VHSRPLARSRTPVQTRGWDLRAGPCPLLREREIEPWTPRKDEGHRRTEDQPSRVRTKPYPSPIGGASGTQGPNRAVGPDRVGPTRVPGTKPGYQTTVSGTKPRPNHDLQVHLGSLPQGGLATTPPLRIVHHPRVDSGLPDFMVPVTEVPARESFAARSCGCSGSNVYR
jgi:hypothetical protein